MEGSSSNSKVDIIRPVILKAGIPIAISVAGFIFAKIVSTRRKPTETLHGEDSESHDEKDTSLEVRDTLGFQEEILGLSRMVESLQQREWKLEMQFLRYCELRDREALLLQIGNALESELGRVEALSKEVLSIESEQKRVIEIAIDCLKSENGAVQRKLKRISRRVKRVEVRESESVALEKVEGEVRELRKEVEKLQQEKDELLIKLRAVEESVSKTRQESVSISDFERLVKEMEEVHKEQAAEEKELIFLKWSNACLRHEMTRNHINHVDDRKTNSSELEVQEETGCGNYESDQEGDSLKTSIGGNHSSKRKKFLMKLKRWMEGNGNDHGRVRAGAGEEFLCYQGKRSCSSA